MRRKQFRVCCETEYTDEDGHSWKSVHEDRRKYSSLAQASKRALVYTDEPWKAYGKAADDHWCSHGLGGCDGVNWEGVFCSAPDRTAREYWETKRAETKFKLPHHVWIEFRYIESWCLAEAVIEAEEES